MLHSVKHIRALVMLPAGQSPDGAVGYAALAVRGADHGGRD
jgi:hypothetical protein